jgi:hypothetical protein
MTKLATGFLIFTLTSYNENLVTRQGLGCEVIARVDGKRSLAQKSRVDTEAQEERGGQGDKETRRQGDKEKGRKFSIPLFTSSPCLLVSLSPCLLVPLSPCPLVPLSLSISPSGLKIRIEGLKKIWKKRYEEKLKLS